MAVDCFTEVTDLDSPGGCPGVNDLLILTNPSTGLSSVFTWAQVKACANSFAIQTVIVPDNTPDPLQLNTIQVDSLGNQWFVDSFGDVTKIENAGLAETDPVFMASPAQTILSGDITNWNDAYAAYVLLGSMAYENTTSYYTKAQLDLFFAGTGAPAGYNKANWDAAHTYTNSVPNFAASKILFGDGDQIPATDTVLHWDNTAKSLALGTATPSTNTRLTIVTQGDTSSYYAARMYQTNGTTEILSLRADGALILKAGFKFIPVSNSATAIQITNAAGTPFVTFDSTNSNMILTSNMYMAANTSIICATVSNTLFTIGSNSFEHKINTTAGAFYWTTGAGALRVLQINGTGEVGFGTSTYVARFEIALDKSITSANWGNTEGGYIRQKAAIITDTTSTNPTTNSVRIGNSYGVLTFDSTNSGVTITDAYANWYEAPVGTARTVLTNAWVAGFNGNVKVVGKLVVLSAIRLKGYTVGTLPAGTQGDTAFVTDALAPAFLVAVAGGGAVVTTVFYNGAAWVAQ